ncbi:MAG: formate dehydrogenase accessory sulfurtransferase FdhD [Candidatus Bipolaricaulaceae bacterium]
MPARLLLRIPHVITPHVRGFTATGAFHYAFLFDQDLSLRQVARDIGRHNAVDKAIEQQLLARGRLEDSFLYLTGRITQQVVAKCVRAGLPLAASPGAALAGAVALARERGLGLVGFLRGGRFNVYSRPDLIG